MLALPGCGDSTIDKRAEVSGTVQLDGKPVESGAIGFVPIEGNSGPSAGAAITNGSYRVDRKQGPPIGKVRVEFNGLKRTGKKVQGKFGGGKTEDEFGELFPAQFNVQSNVVRELQPGTNSIDFDLKSK